mgnify:FL=1
MVVRIPEPEIYNESDGTVRISIGDQRGWVSSHHLIDPKVNQLTLTWLKIHTPS